MASPTLTSLTYDRPDNTMRIDTPGVPGSSGTGPLNMNALYEMFRYKAATKAWEARKQAEMMEREMRLKEQLQRAQLDAMTRAEQLGARGGEGGGVAAPSGTRDRLGTEDALAMARPADFGSMRADRYGNWGTFVDPANIPAALQGTIMGGQYGDLLNWDSANPMITGPQQAISGKYR